MNKYKIELYGRALAEVLDEFGISEAELFRSNNAECVQARTALIVALSKMLSDGEIAELTKKMRRCSVCVIRNRYDDRTAPWTVRRCIDAIKAVTN
jgi:crotonobetainyl-CoA:carnitine CoA-transferase CaiB-like acyl-CoA transferase